MYVYFCSAVRTASHTGTVRRDNQSWYPAAAASSSAAIPATLTGPALPSLSMSRRMRLTNLYVAISQYRVCTVLYVPYRAVGVSICKSTNRHMLARPTEPASGLRHCSIWLWLAHSAGQASGALPSSICCSPPSARFAAQTRSTALLLLLLAPKTGRGRIARNERARLASVCKASRALARGAVAKPMLLSLPSRPSGTYHAAPKLAHAMVRGRSWSKERGVTACGCVSEVCLPSLEQSSASVSAVVVLCPPTLAEFAGMDVSFAGHAFCALVQPRITSQASPDM
jgi:hypothetical protein